MRTMRSWIFALALVASLLGAFGLCVPSAFGGGPAILEPPPYEHLYTPAAVAAFFLTWLALIVMLLTAETYDRQH